MKIRLMETDGLATLRKSPHRLKSVLLRQHAAVIWNMCQQRALADKARWSSARKLDSGTRDRADQGRRPGGTHPAPHPSLRVSSLSSHSYLNLPLCGVDDLQTASAHFRVPSAKMAT